MALSGEALESVVVHPLFYDALSGEFTPPSDPETQHTLGRLTFAVLAKGERNTETQAIDAVSYSPSWAPEVTATVAYSDNPDDEYRLVTGLWLRADTSNQTLHIADNRLRSGHVGVYLASAGVRELPLSLGQELNEARSRVTDAAQRFFDSVQ